MRPAFYIINALTVYRLLMAPVLAGIAWYGNETLFKWLLPVSFFTDLIDGWLARRFRVTSKAGTKLDSIADDLTIVAAMVGLFIFRPGFAAEQKMILWGLFVLFILQNIAAFWRYGTFTSYHTYAAKISAILQGCFLILLFLLPEPVYILFYAAAVITAIDLAEEIIIVAILPQWKSNVKGLYWLWKGKKKK